MLTEGNIFQMKNDEHIDQIKDMKRSIQDKS